MSHQDALQPGSAPDGQDVGSGQASEGSDQAGKVKAKQPIGQPLAEVTLPRSASGNSLHASCVAVEGRALLITGPSGSGKSGLALQLMALGAHLVADDRCLLSAEGGRLWASCPEPIRGLIEARFLGILRAEPLLRAEVAAQVDLETMETERLPLRREITHQGIVIPLLRGSPGLSFAAALYQYLKGGRES